MKQIEKDVRDYFNKCLSKDEIEDNPVNALVFSYLMGMDPKECRGMELESEMDSSQIDEYYEVEGIINKIKREIKESNN